MTVFFCSVNSAFYDDDIYGDQLPKNAVEISADLHQALLDAQSMGKQIVADKNGQPMAADRPGPTYEQQVERERFWRDTELVRTDMFVTRHRDELDAGRATTLTEQMYQQLQRYRLALRDWPDQDSFPDEVLRPKAPKIA